MSSARRDRKRGDRRRRDRKRRGRKRDAHTREDQKHGGPTPDAESPDGPSGRRRWPLVVAGLLLAVPLLWWGGVRLATLQGEAALQARHPERAVRWLRWAGYLGDRSSERQLLLARAYRKAGDIPAFQTTLESAVVAGLDAERARRETILAMAQGGRVSEVESELSRLLLDPAEDGREILEAFTNGYIAGYRIEEATPLMDAWAAEYPDDPKVYLMQGRVEEHKGRWDDAVAAYERAMAVAPGYGPAAYNLARIQLKRKQPEEALQSYRVAGEWLDDDTPAVVGMAHCYRMLNKTEEARALLTPLLERGDSAAARRAFGKVGQTSESARTAVEGELGQVELAAGNYDEAVRLLSAALEQNPLDQTLHYMLARALSGAGRKDDAGPHLTFYREASAATAELDKAMEALRNDPNNADLRSQIGRTFLEYLSVNQGLVWLNGALTFDPKHGPTHRALAAYYQRKADAAPPGSDEQADATRKAARHYRSVPKDNSAGDAPAADDGADA